jgi:hypothetical protein
VLCLTLCSLLDRMPARRRTSQEKDLSAPNLPGQSGKTLTRMFLKCALLIWPGIGGCPCRAKVPRGNQVPVLFGILCLISASGTVYSNTILPFSLTTN